MPLRERLRKIKSDTKLRFLQSIESKDKNMKTGKSPTPPVQNTPHDWVYLKTSCRSLEQAAKSFSPLEGALTDLIECCDDYHALYNELEKLFQLLNDSFTLNIPPVINTAIESLCRSLREEVVFIRQRQDQGKIRAYLEANHDVDEVLTCYRRIQSYLQRISLNTNMFTWKIADEIATDNRLKHLLPSLSARYNSTKAVELKRGPCTKNTRVLLLAQIHVWVESSGPGSIYWMNGMAGTGKTTIGYSLCEELDACRKLAASFFCPRLLPECRDINLVVPTIAYQLARSSHSFRCALSNILEQDPDIHTILPYIQFDALISKPLLEMKYSLPENLVVVIDALDECESKDSTRRIIHVLLARSAGLPVKFVVSSRPEPEIRDEMINQTNQAESRVVLHELDKQTVQTDIKAYLRDALVQAQATEEQISAMAERAGILFIYAATVVRYVGHGGFRRSHARLANVLESSSTSENKYKEIDELYTVVLQAALGDPELESGEKKDMQLVLDSVICAQEPLTVNALSQFLRMKNAEYVRAALSTLWSVLHISGSSELVTTLHASFPDYMLDSPRSGKFYCDSKAHNQNMALRCFDLHREIRPQFNIYGLESSYIPDNQVKRLEEQVQKAISDGLLYASRCWGTYVQYSAGDTCLISELEEFLSVRLLLRMEVMNLKKYTEEMSKVLQIVERWEAERSPELNALIHDAWRFTSTFMHGAVSESTPHIYTSILPFWPESSPIFKAYGRYTHRMMRVEGTAVGQRYHGLLATWTYGGSITSSALSPDGTQIAAGVWFDVLLLDSSTGQRLLPPLEGHGNYIRCIDFSPDGRHIVSGSDNGSVYVWSTRDGEAVIGPLADDCGLSSVAFSPDGAHIVFGTSSGDIYIRDGSNGDFVIDIPSPYDNWVSSVKYSPDGRCIVASSSWALSGDTPVLIWDAQTGTVLRTLAFEDSPSHFSFADISPDGTRIAAGSTEGCVYIWDFRTRQVTLGPLIVPGADTAIKRDTHSGDLILGPLERHTGTITLLKFLPDNNHFISGSMDDNLCLSDTRSMMPTPDPLQGHVSMVTSACFSSDGNRIVSHSDDNYIKAIHTWYTDSGEMALGPTEVNHTYSGAKFSPDGVHIVLVLSDGILLLDSHTGDIAMDPLKLPGSIQSIVFSPEGACIASGTANNIARISAVGTGQSLMTFHLQPSDSKDSPSSTTSVESPSLADCITAASDIESGASRITSAELSEDFTLIAIVSDEALCIHATHDGRVISSPFDVRLYTYTSIKFSQDNALIGYSTGAGSLVVRDVQSGSELLELQEDGLLSRDFDFSPDGSHIVAI
ncbi:WD40 repeat-like protein, partial [Rhizoctonia solani]